MISNYLFFTTMILSSVGHVCCWSSLLNSLVQSLYFSDIEGFWWFLFLCWTSHWVLNCFFLLHLVVCLCSSLNFYKRIIQNSLWEGSVAGALLVSSGPVMFTWWAPLWGRAADWIPQLGSKHALLTAQDVWWCGARGCTQQLAGLLVWLPAQARL